MNFRILLLIVVLLLSLPAIAHPDDDWLPVTDAENQAILDHLTLMTTEPGWHPEQRTSAQAALEILGQEANPP